jgi:hypothetical protein
MRAHLLTALALAAAFAATPGLTAADPIQPTTPQAAPQTAPKTPGPDDVICKREEETGSRIPGAKVCHTRREWDQMSADARDGVDGVQSRGDYLAYHRGG